MHALRGKVMILPKYHLNEKPTETESGLYVHGGYNPEGGLRRGTIVSIGEGVRDVKEGDEVCYMAHSGIGFKRDDTQYLTMGEEEIVGITNEL
jgi:co-chaperonin GroES (HSP10)